MCLLARNGTAAEKTGLAVTFTTATPAEKPETKAATGETGTTATLHGVLNPGGTATTKAGWYFAYNTEATCTGPSEAQTGHEGELEGKAVPVTPTEVTGLQPHKTYKLCLIATNTAGEPTPGNTVSFTTLAAAPSIDSQSAPTVSSTGATLEAQVNPNNEDTHSYFQYATTSAVDGSGSLTGATQIPTPPGSDLGAAFGDVPLGPVALTGLAAGTTYFYQAVAANVTSTTYGAVQEFTTVPTPSTDALGPVTATTATFNGHLKPLNPDSHGAVSLRLQPRWWRLYRGKQHPGRGSRAGRGHRTHGDHKRERPAAERAVHGVLRYIERVWLRGRSPDALHDPGRTTKDR